VLHARTATHVLVEGPGGRVYINRILQPGDAYRVPDLVGLSLTTSDGSVVFLELDGQDMGMAGHAGQMTEALPLDPQAIVDRTHGKNPG
jgi:cytoskeleton protein RodZ